MRLSLLNSPRTPQTVSRAGGLVGFGETQAGMPVPPGLETGPRSISAVKMLRISVTDRCNFRCLYCMPADGVRWLPKDDILTFEEIVDVVRAAIDIHGIRRFKLTGGEPTVRHGLTDLVRMLRRVEGIEDLSLTTNGFCLEDLALPLREAGLDRVTISVDSLQPEKFRRITRTGELEKVLRGLRRAVDVGFTSVKINCVAMRGTNDDEFGNFARLALDLPVTVRFIEYMPLGDAALIDREEATPGAAREVDGNVTQLSGGRNPRLTPRREPRIASTNQSQPSAFPRNNLSTVAAEEIGPAGGCGAQDRGAGSFIAEADIRAAVERAVGELEPVDRASEAGVGPANVYRPMGRGGNRESVPSPAAGRIGFISAMSAPFCSTCNRLRLTANGVLRSCLFEGGEVDLKPILRAHRPALQGRIGAESTVDMAESTVGSRQSTVEEDAARRAALARAMTDCVRLKPDVHSRRGNEQMSRIGG